MYPGLSLSLSQKLGYLSNSQLDNFRKVESYCLDMLSRKRTEKEIQLHNPEKKIGPFELTSNSFEEKKDTIFGQLAC